MKTGRKTKHTPDKLAAIYKAVENGMSYKDACAVSGISEATFYEWKKSKPEFLETLCRAEAKGQKVLLNKIRASKDWRASAWILERRYETWNRKEKIETEQNIKFTGAPSLEDLITLFNKAATNDNA